MRKQTSRVTKTRAANRKNVKLNAVEQDLVAGFDGFVKALRGDKQLEKEYTRRRVSLELNPSKYGPQEVRATRMILKASQGIFAGFLGVSIMTVRAWEQGKAPSEMARRFMDEIRQNPTYWRGRLAQVTRMRTPS